MQTLARLLDKEVLRAAFPLIRRSTVLQDEPNVYTVLVPYGETADQHVNVSFFGTIGFVRIGEPNITDDSTHVGGDSTT